MESSKDLTIYDVYKNEPLFSWRPFFEQKDLEIKYISDSIEEYKQRTKKKVFPNPKLVFNAFQLTDLDDVRVVFVGQDPYPQYINHLHAPRAKGLSFSVHPDDDIPSSLQNIFKEIKRTYPDFKYKNGDLTKWASQGCLMLNLTLTVPEEEKNGHEGLWTGFISHIIETLKRHRPQACYVLWGAFAQKLTKVLDKNSKILISPHPSGMSAHKGFIGNNHFVEINKYLKSINEPEIDWNLDVTKKDDDLE